MIEQLSFTNYIEQIKKAIIKKLKWEKIDSCYIALNPIEDYLIYSKQPVNKKNYYNYIWRGILNEIQKRTFDPKGYYTVYMCRNCHHVQLDNNVPCENCRW